MLILPGPGENVSPEAGDPADQEMILRAVRQYEQSADGQRVNDTVKDRLRQCLNKRYPIAGYIDRAIRDSDSRERHEQEEAYRKQERQQQHNRA